MASSPKHPQDLRRLYALIYRWHRNEGIAEIARRYPLSGDRNNQWTLEYRTVVANLLSPDEATEEHIESVARRVLAGCMEWSYCDEVTADVTMASAAKQILHILEAAQDEKASLHVEEVLRSLKNIGSESREPRTVEVTMRRELFEGNLAAVHSQLASRAYSDVAEAFAGTTLGGTVALADCNFEKEMNSTEASRGVLRFRNAAALHLELDTTHQSIVELVKAGVVEIDSVELGVSQ